MRDLCGHSIHKTIVSNVYLHKKKRDLVNTLKNFTMMEVNQKLLMFTQYQLVSAKHYDIMWKTHDLCKNNNKKRPMDE